MDNGHNMDIALNKKSPKPLWFGLFKWRWWWDSYFARSRVTAIPCFAIVISIF